MTASDKTLIAVGLVDHIAGHEVCESPGPPEGGPGALFAWRKPGEGGLKWGYAPDEQTWTPAAAAAPTIPAARYYVGIDKQNPPTEFDLRRPVQFRGHRVTLNNDEQWLIPAPQELPADCILDDDGHWKTEPRRQFQAFNIAAAKWFEFMAMIPPDGEMDIDFNDAVGFVVQALSINYRITPEIVSALRLFRSDMITPAIYAACGLLSSAGQKVED